MTRQRDETIGDDERQADLLDQYWRTRALDAAAPEGPDRELVSLTRKLWTEVPAEPPSEGFIAQLRARIDRQTAPNSNSGARYRRNLIRLAMGSGLVAFLLTASFLLLGQPGREARVASAEDVLRKVRTTTLSPQSAGISSLALKQSWVTYFLGGERQGMPSWEVEVRVWYQAPDRQRIESDSAQWQPDGSRKPGRSVVEVWDGNERWDHRVNEGAVTVYRQDRDQDPYAQGEIYGLPGFTGPGHFEASPCRTAELAREEELRGRMTQVVELGRPRCGLAPPGADGKGVLWVDKTTGLVLRMEQYSVDGRLAMVVEVSSVEFNPAMEAGRFSFSPPPDAQVRDRRPALGPGYQVAEPPQYLTLQDAREAATFPVRVPETLPAGFTLESIEHYWPDHVRAEDRAAKSVTADWLLFRYSDAGGNWLVITQGFGGYLAGMAMAAPEANKHTTEVNGKAARWVEGDPVNRWETGTMTSLAWEAGRFGSGWAATPSGETATGSPLSIALGSNTLSVDGLKAVAESLR